MSLPLLITGTIGIDTIITPRGRAEGVLGGSVSFAAVAALLFADRVDAVSIIGEDFPVHYEEALAAKGLCMDGVERKKGPSFAWTGEYFDNMNKRRTVCANDSVMLDWQVNVQEALRSHPVLVCCCMVPAQQLKCMEQCPDASLVLSDSMDKWLRRQPELLDAVISRSHITMMNEDEAKEYAGASTILEAGEFLLSRGATYAVVKQGEYGATLIGREKDGRTRIFRCPAYPLKTLVDPTGAGDTFLGALAGYLSTLPEGLPSFEDMKRGIVYGTAAMLDGMVAQIRAALGAPDAPVVATGTLPDSVRTACATDIVYRETLVLEGLYWIWKKNTRK